MTPLHATTLSSILNQKRLSKATLRETEREKEREREHGIVTEETSEIVLSQPALANTVTNDAKNSTSLSNPSEIEQSKQPKGWGKGITLMTGESMTAKLREAKLLSNNSQLINLCPYIYEFWLTRARFRRSSHHKRDVTCLGSLCQWRKNWGKKLELQID